jgi:hypothetical protein
MKLCGAAPTNGPSKAAKSGVSVFSRQNVLLEKSPGFLPRGLQCFGCRDAAQALRRQSVWRQAGGINKVGRLMGEYGMAVWIQQSVDVKTVPAEPTHS